MNLGVLAAVSAPTAGLVIALIALYRAKAQQRKDISEARRIEADLNRDIANRRITLELWADEVQRYNRTLRDYLYGLVDEGIIDMSRVDMSKFPRLPMLPQISDKQ